MGAGIQGQVYLSRWGLLISPLAHAARSSISSVRVLPPGFYLLVSGLFENDDCKSRKKSLLKSLLHHGTCFQGIYQ